MIDMLNNWMLESYQNFNIIIGLIIILYVGPVSVFLYISKKFEFGKPDERTNGIYLKICSLMLTTQLIMNTIFIFFVGSDIENFRQIFALFQGIVFLVGAIYSVRLYKKDC